MAKCKKQQHHYRCSKEYYSTRCSVKKINMAVLSFMGGPKSKPVACRKHKTLRGCGNLTFDKLRDLKPIWIAMTGRPPGPDDCAVNLHAIGWSPLGGRHQNKEGLSPWEDSPLVQGCR